MKMIDMAKTPEEIKEDMADMPSPIAGGKYSGPKYPYGICISLDDETLEKLGLAGALPSVGEMINFQALARVTSASENERETSDGATEKCCRVELQITHMGVAAPERERNWYGGGNKMVQDNDNDEE